MSSTLIKSYNVNYASGNEQEKKKKRVIDSNQAVSERIKALSEILEATPEEDFADDFNEGLDAAQVDALLADQDEVAEEKARNEAAEKLVEEANEQAQAILADANEQAERIIAEANEKAQAILEDARQQGLAEGNEQGYNEGLQRAAQVEEEAKAKAAQLDEEYEAKLSELEPKFVETLTDIYSHVFGTDLTGRNDVVLALLKNAMRSIEGGKNFLVHVSKEDHQFVSDNRDDLIAGLGNSVTVEVIEDMTLSSGSSFIETDSGIYDCSIGTELELLKKELKILSYNG